jgi:hypothetical protein
MRNEKHKTNNLDYYLFVVIIHPQFEASFVQKFLTSDERIMKNMALLIVIWEKKLKSKLSHWLAPTRLG